MDILQHLKQRYLFMSQKKCIKSGDTTDNLAEKCIILNKNEIIIIWLNTLKHI